MSYSTGVVSEKNHTPRAAALVCPVLDPRHPDIDTKICKLGEYNAQTTEILIVVHGRTEQITASTAEEYSDFRQYLQDAFQLSYLPSLSIELTMSDLDPWLSSVPYPDASTIEYKRRLLSGRRSLFVDEHNFLTVMATLHDRQRKERMFVN